MVKQVVTRMASNLPPVHNGKPSLSPNQPPPANLKGQLVRILLEDDPDIPPTGLFIGVNGRSYMLKSGVEVNVPVSIIEVLNNAVKSVSIVDSRTLQVVGSRDRMRFPYRVITQVRPAEAA